MTKKCRWCDNKVVFRAGGKKGNRRLHSDKDHDLCGRCFRDLENKVKHGGRRERQVVLSRQVGPFLPLHVLLAQDQVRRGAFVEPGTEYHTMMSNLYGPR